MAGRDHDCSRTPASRRLPVAVADRVASARSSAALETGRLVFGQRRTLRLYVTSAPYPSYPRQQAHPGLGVPSSPPYRLSLALEVYRVSNRRAPWVALREKHETSRAGVTRVPAAPTGSTVRGWTSVTRVARSVRTRQVASIAAPTTRCVVVAGTARWDQIVSAPRVTWRTTRPAASSAGRRTQAASVWRSTCT